MAMSLFPTKSGGAVKRRNSDALEALDRAGLIEFVALDPGKGTLRTTGLYKVRFEGQTLLIPTGDVPAFALGVLVGSQKAVGPNGRIRPFVPGAWSTNVLWFAERVHRITEQADNARSCTGAPGCEQCRPGKGRDRGVCRQVDDPAAAERGFTGCAPCWDNVVLYEAGAEEHMTMALQSYAQLSDAELAELDPGADGVALVVAAYAAANASHG